MRGIDFFEWIFREGRRFQSDENNLTEFLTREYKKAERDEFYNLESFFTPLKNKVSDTKSRISEKYEKEKIRYQKLIEKAKIGELTFRTEYYSIGIYKEVGIDDYFKRRNQEVHKQFCEEFKALTIYDIISHQGGYKLDYVEFFERGLEKAMKELAYKPKQSNIGVKAWAIVFYYAIGGDEIKISNVEEFKAKHNLKCSTDSLKNKIYSVRKEITDEAPKRSIISQIEKAIDVLRLYYPGKVWSAEDSLRDIKVDVDHQSN